MFFLNLTAAEFLTLFGALGGLVTALYLLDRARRRKVVSTLQFWIGAGAAEQTQARRKMQQPWSFLLQMASLLLLLLAISRMQWGNSSPRGHDAVLLIDTGSWAAARSADHPGTVLQEEERQALAYLNGLARNDRVMLVAVNGVPDPLIRFTSNQAELKAALERMTPTYSATDMNAALAFAQQALSWSGTAAGEIVYIGPELTTDQPLSGKSVNLRSIRVAADRENCGIVQLTAEQREDEANTWKSLVKVKNYGQEARAVRLELQYGGTRFASRQLHIPAGQELTEPYIFTTRAAGRLTASLTPGGTLTSDDRASLFLPKAESAKITLFTDRPKLMQPLLAANAQLSATIRPTSAFTKNAAADVVILDSFSPASFPSRPTLWIAPSKDHPPIPIDKTIKESLLKWNTRSSLEAALRAKALRLPSATTFKILPGDEALASVFEGPVVVLRDGNGVHPRMAVVGFDPLAGELRFEVATPLLFADLLQWLDPAALRSLTLTAVPVGLIHVSLLPGEQRGRLEVTNGRRMAVPFSRRQADLQVFSDQPTSIHIASDEQERVVSVTLTAVADHVWTVPKEAARGLPASARFAPAAADLWKWLALGAAFTLLLEWFLFGRPRRLRRSRFTNSPNASSGRLNNRELVSK